MGLARSAPLLVLAFLPALFPTGLCCHVLAQDCGDLAAEFAQEPPLYLDDRLEIVEAEVTIHCLGGPRRFARLGPLWLGLVAGMQIELARVDEGG